MRRRQNGFTLIELISVIVILGVLGAFAMPRFANVESKARASSAAGLAGAMRSAVALVHAVWLANGANVRVVELEGAEVEVDERGYPLNLVEVRNAMALDPVGNGYVLVEDTVAPEGAARAPNCGVSYDTASSPPIVVVVTTDCS